MEQILLTILIPIHTLFNEKDKEYFLKAIESIKKNQGFEKYNLLIVHTQELSEYKIDASIFTGINVSYLKNTGATDFSSQINFAANNINTEYFTILEQDDEFSEIAFKSFEEYRNFYKNVSVFLPIAIDIDENDNFLKFNGVESLSRSIVGTEGEVGVITHQVANSLPSQILSGSYFKIEDFKQIGGLKKNMSIAFLYEFILRATHNDQNLLVIPRLGYLHRNGRAGSYLDQINNSGIGKDEVTFWFDQAKKEYYFTKDRVVSYKIQETV